MLDKVDFPLTNSQISNFFLEKDYTDYFRVQEVITDLENADLIISQTTHSNTRYSLTAAGKETLGFFLDKINEGIVDDVIAYFSENRLSMKEENSIIADYYKTTGQKYAVRCQALSNSAPVIDLTISVYTKEQAEAICTNWKKHHQDIYEFLMDVLIQ